MESTTYNNSNVTLVDFMESEPTTMDTFMEEVETYTSFKIATLHCHLLVSGILVPVGCGW